ncbi:N-6 DNA methylase [Embleya sp. NPDC005575]|uniref:Eco57I restriction-modification methylase domain-containing protein n=1 Tax=Embleya sp. NPDC005575 TaxID=3156892 RepID=UPI0033BC78AD
MKRGVIADSISAVRVENSLLPIDLLSRIVDGEGVPGLKPADYVLVGNETVRDAAGRAWAYLRPRWVAFRAELAKQPENAPDIAITRQHWLLLLFRELGFGNLAPATKGAFATEDGGHEFPVSHHWEHIPIHLLGWGLDLDKRHPGVSGATLKPQSMMQDCLNRTDSTLWGVLSNGRVLRLLRDSASLTGSAYVEFDVESIFEGELYADFVLLYLTVHQSRFAKLSQDENTGPADCWLEKWRLHAIDTGTRALNQLRDGVRDAIATLGSGFLQETANAGLRERIARGSASDGLTLADYHRSLLRTVYRLLFLFVAEDRDMLLDPDADLVAKERYRSYYSTARLRRVSRKRVGDSKGDLWRALMLVVEKLALEEGAEPLALPGLGGIFEPSPMDVLNELTLPNHALLKAFRELAWLRDKGGRPRAVDYEHLGAEELGSVYESLLEEVPRYDPASHAFWLERLSGNERKTTGSYYTPTSLIECLLDSTLDPLITQALNQLDPEAALLKLTVCDPSCGSGHFLVAAARRLARALAYVRTGDPEPLPSDVRHAMRDVVSHCIHGVDLNPLSAELAKVSLWLESLDPGQPLAFLDAQIKVGNSLLGSTPRLLAGGIPDEAFKALDGDNPKVIKSLKARNIKEKAGQSSLFETPGVQVANGVFAARLAEVVQAQPRNLIDVHTQAQKYRDFMRLPDLVKRREVADAWCASFVNHKLDAMTGITTATFEQLDMTPESVPATTRAEIARLSEQYRFFHWHLEFPHIFRVNDMDAEGVDSETGWAGGFSCVVGNPPWERVKLQDKEFFATEDEAIANAPNKAARDRMIKALLDTEPGRQLHARYVDAKRRAEGESRILRASGRYPLTGRGDVNTYAVFTETASIVIEPSGRFGLVLPTGIATDATTAPFFSDLVRRSALVSFLDFENEAFLLSRDVHHSVRFCLLSAGGKNVKVGVASFAFGTRHIEDLDARRFAMPPEEILLVNPNTGTLPVFRSRRDAEITLGIYRRLPVLIREGVPDGNPWALSFLRMFDMANDSDLFRMAESFADENASGAVSGRWDKSGDVYHKGRDRFLPLYEAKMMHHYDHRLGTYEGQTTAQSNMGTLPRVTADEHDEPAFTTQPRYWVSEKIMRTKLAQNGQSNGSWDGETSADLPMSGP